MHKSNWTFGNSKLDVVYAIAHYETRLYTYKYQVIDKIIKTTRTTPEWNSGGKRTIIELSLKVIEYCGKPYDTNHIVNIKVNSKYPVYCENNVTYCCSKCTFEEFIGYEKRDLLNSLALCDFLVSPNKGLKTVGIFEDAKTGDRFETIDGRIAHYLFKFYANNNPNLEFHHIYIEGETSTSSYRKSGEGDGHNRHTPKIIRKL